MSTHRDSSTLIKILAILLLITAGALVFTMIQHRQQLAAGGGGGGQAAVEPRPITPSPDHLGADEQSTIAVFREVSSSVVHITSVDMVRNRISMNIEEIPQGTGSGFVWDDAGHILTNFHVVQNGNSARVTLQDRSVYTAKLVGKHPDKDIAVLKIDAPPSKLRKIMVGTSSDLQVGQKVLAIGNPFGFDQTLTTGVISGLGREIKSVTQRPISDVIQTDAPINPGNSGGPLLDSSGRLIGINTAIFSPSGAYAGIGFAVPVDTVNGIVPQLIKHGRVTRPGLGITIASDQWAQRNGITGVLVHEVVPGGAAASAGILGTRTGPDGLQWILGDIINGIDGKPIARSADLYKLLDDHKVGDKVKVTIKSGGQQREVEVTLQALP